MERRRVVVVAAGLAMVLVAAVLVAVLRSPEKPKVKGLVVNEALGLVYEGLREGTGLCKGLLETIALTAKFCTHGPDPAPPGTNVKSPPPGPATPANAGGGAIVCQGTGTDGPRVQALYVVPADRTNRFSAVLPSIRAYATAADGIFNDSAAETGGSRHIRWQTDPDCKLSVITVAIPAAADDSFGGTIEALGRQGFNRSDRKYAIWADSAVLCGIGTIQGDDRPGADNANNRGSSYARVDTKCWGGRPEAHEIMHMLGGVQLSAPNSSRGYHCVDESDLMCYSDSPHYPPMRSACPGSHEGRFDCNHDDFYSTHPQGYLVSHWNAANSAFLIGGGPPPGPNPGPSPTTAPPATSTTRRCLVANVFC